MRRTATMIAGFAVLALALAPGLADARAGGGSSMGSRGGRTYSAPPSTNTAPSFAAPMERSYTPRVAPTPSPGFTPAPGYAPGLSRGGGFASGLLGGLIGAGIGGMLFGHGMFGGFSGIGSVFGLLIQLALLFFVVRWVFRMFARRGQPAFAGMGAAPGGMFRQSANVGAAPAGGSGGAGSPAVPITRADYTAFGQVLQQVQQAWSAGDLGRMAAVATPEMVGYFNEQLSELASRGHHNTVTDVSLQKGDLSEAWAERGREYATVAMRFSMIDVTRDGTGHVVDGSPTEHTVATELWTFLRSPGGTWVLSAIQQAR